MLRGFAAPEDMTAERRRALLSANPFNAGQVITALEMDSYAPFPFLPPIRTGDRGGVYEVRTYRLKPGACRRPSRPGRPRSGRHAPTRSTSS